jgi:Ca-activated chloride channel homolog
MGQAWLEHPLAAVTGGKLVKRLLTPRAILCSASAASLVLLVALLVHVLRQPERFSLIGLVLTPDQQAQRQFRRGAFAEAAQRFTDPYWQAAAYYRAGDFKQAAGIYTGLDTPQAAFNYGNALVMLGQYEPAMARYDRALQLHPGWEAAQVNREIARQRAARVKQEGGEGTGGQLSADAIVFTQGKNPSQQEGDQDTSTEGAMSDAELRNRWLRRVQTAPADFLRAKFAYQVAMKDSKP